MPSQRSEGKEFIGWWAPARLRSRLKAFTGPRSITDTDVLNQALADWLDRNETTSPESEDQ